MKKLWIAISVLVLSASVMVLAYVQTTINDFTLAGSQPGQSGNIEHPGKCDNCHGGYDQAVEPAFNWRGSMMAQAARDQLFYACLAIANQDAPESGDLCIRCHAPDGWLQGRSLPTDGSALNNNDREGVQCDFCHKLVKPVSLAFNPYPDDQIYTDDTYPRDQVYLSTLSDIPPAPANGMYVADSDNAKRGPFADAAARHQMYYSPFQRDAALCGTCHDVSNPVFDRAPGDDYTPNTMDSPPPSFDPYNMFPIERTYSEWSNSEYASTGVYAPEFAGNKPGGIVSTCQDCHLRDVAGLGCNKKGAPSRDDLPLHDMTGGNTFIPITVSQLYPDEVDHAALDAGVLRATEMLQKAASLDLNVAPQGADLLATVRVTNETGHKLPSGYPEGRRIWLNVKAYDTGGILVYESCHYDSETAELDHDPDAKIYEIKPGLSPGLAGALGLPAGPSFHFVLNDTIYSDNRIPLRGFTNADFEAIQSEPVDYSYADYEYWDDTGYIIPGAAAKIEVTLYYQTLSKEYVTFLRDSNTTSNDGQILYDLWSGHGKSAPVAMNSLIYEIPQPVPPVADFVGDPTSGNVPLTVNFTDLSTNGPSSWSWVFGDGGTSTAQNPTYTYETAGIYSVTLTATNAYGSDALTRTDYIAVSEGLVMHVSNIVVTREAGKGGRYRGIAAVTIVDVSDNPVPGAAVTGDFTGPTSETGSGTTDSNGQAVITSGWIKNPTGEWCFAVTNVSKGGATYDPESNIVTQACESGPVSMGSRALSSRSPYTTGFWNHPNPFRGTTEISFMLPSSTHVSIDIYNAMGQRVATVAQGRYGAGVHSVTWNCSDVTSGVYFCRLTAGERVMTRRMILLK